MPNPSDILNGPTEQADADGRALEEGAAPGATEAAEPEPRAGLREPADVEAIARERDDYYDRLLRKTAEFENYRKRTDRERREQAEYAAAEVLKDLLPVIDDLERALEASSESAEAYRQGVELIHKQMLDLLRKRGVTPIEAVGQDFDPHLHQAVTHEQVPGHRDGEVVAEFRRGYKLRDRLLRPAMVKVAKA
jgi:molecular chaperone GrpE